MKANDKDNMPATPEEDQGQTQEDNGPPGPGPEGLVQINLVGVQLRPGMCVTHFDAGSIPVKEGEWVVAPTEHGREVGHIVEAPVKIDLPVNSLPPKLEGLASTNDIELYYQNLDREKEARHICLEFIRSLGLNMKLIQVERFFEGSKIIFYYFSENRIDFRELVKELVKTLKTRIEMRQIGIRHESKMLGGIGDCGREICCSKFLKNFDPISIKMAKVQNLPLNPSKISGLCGRLLCCLTYEYETYIRLRQEGSLSDSHIESIESSDTEDASAFASIEDIPADYEENQENHRPAAIYTGEKGGHHKKNEKKRDDKRHSGKDQGDRRHKKTGVEGGQGAAKEPVAEGAVKPPRQKNGKKRRGQKETP